MMSEGTFLGAVLSFVLICIAIGMFRGCASDFEKSKFRLKARIENCQKLEPKEARECLKEI